ncbi:MAG: protein-disulfide reductase DsbD family protein [Myxococcota bacterium]
MLRIGTWTLLLLVGLAAPVSGGVRAAEPVSAHGSAVFEDGDPRVEATLLVDAAEARPGEPVRMGVLFDLDPGWHVYWRNPGEAGLPVELDWQVEDAQVGPTHWPAPEVFREQDGLLTTYGYSRQVLLYGEGAFRSSANASRRVRVAADFLACRIQCVPGRIELERTLEIGTHTLPPASSVRRLFDDWAAREPVPPATLGASISVAYSQTAIRPGDAFKVALAVTGATAAGSDPFVPERTPGVTWRVTGTRGHPLAGDGFVVTLEGEASGEAPAGDQVLRGALQVRRGLFGTRWLQVELPLPRAPAGAQIGAVEGEWFEPAQPLAPRIPFWRAVLLALLGGVILNAMPCVLPILALKVFGLTELAQGERRALRLGGLAYAAGISSAMLALAALVIGLRAAGTQVGWGFQFQEPLFVAGISAVLLVFALNLFGVFEIQVHATRLQQAANRMSGLRRSYFEGTLAVVLSTPCSAPFLGTATGFAFVGSPAVIVAIFLAIGAGLALPYAVVTWVPGWARWIPRPGAWMAHLRRGLGFALLATIVWLLWVVGRVLGSQGLVMLLGFLVVLAFGTWLFGLLQSLRPGRGMLAQGALLAGLALAALITLPLEPSAVALPEQSGGTTPAASERAFDPAAIRSELDRGRPVFVYFTADWCITCQVNERLVLESARVRRSFDQLGFERFKADWTRPDERIRKELIRHGRAGVPMYLVYSPRAPERPRVLPEILTVDRLVRALRDAASS